MALLVEDIFVDKVKTDNKIMHIEAKEADVTIRNITA